ncbi:MAG: hypothetical protein ACLP0J_11690 [Solirubrobacteraceae bacterium]
MRKHAGSGLPRSSPSEETTTPEIGGPGSAQTHLCKRGRAGGDDGKTAPTAQQLRGAGKRQHAVGVTNLRRLESGGLDVVVGVRREQTDRLARRAPHVREWCEQVLVEVVLAARNSTWSQEQLDALLSPTAFTAALLPRHLLHTMLRKRLAQKARLATNRNESVWATAGMLRRDRDSSRKPRHAPNGGSSGRTLGESTVSRPGA